MTDNILEIKKLTKEADGYKNAAKFADNQFVAETQLGLYELTMNKIARLEA